MPELVIPTLSEIERIAALPEAVQRNLLITQCYHELELVLAERTGGAANWCTFATWASKQAGQTIRKEDLGRALEATLGSEAAVRQAIQDLALAARRLGAHLEAGQVLALIWQAYDPPAAFDHASAAVASGNLKVFAEIGFQFARFYAECLPDQLYREENITRFCEQLRPADPPEGQGYLRAAFQHYYQALFTEDPLARAQLLLLANLEIGYHEQVRLQPEINAALNAPVIPPQDFARNLIKVLRPQGGWLNDLLWTVLSLLGQLTRFDSATGIVLAGAQRQAQFLVTETMMSIDLPPPNRLRLGDDLAARFPPDLQRLSNPELLELLARIDPTPNSTRASGALYWGDLPDRMHFIADLFRCYQASPQLHEPPFSPEQSAALRAGNLPPGPL